MRRERLSVDVRAVGVAWLVSRGVMLAVALVLMIRHGHLFGDMVSNWDVQHFISIARKGYENSDPQDVAFFPAVPILLAFGEAAGIAPWVTGTLLSLGCSILAAAALVRLGGKWAAIGWLFAPVAVFTAVPYTEAMFCALAFWAWVWAKRDDWMLAGVLAMAACTTRVSGLFLWGALGVLLLTKHSVRAWWSRLPWLVLPLLALFGYALYLHHLTGSWTAWYSAQEAGWQRSLAWPWTSIYRTGEMIASGYVDANGWGMAVRGELVAFAVGLVTVGWCLGRRLWAEASWVAVQLIAFSMSYWLMSVNRAVLLWFPTWMMLAAIIDWRPATRRGRIVKVVFLDLLATAMVVMMVWWTQQFLTGGWSS